MNNNEILCEQVKCNFCNEYGDEYYFDECDICKKYMCSNCGDRIMKNYRMLCFCKECLISSDNKKIYLNSIV